MHQEDSKPLVTTVLRGTSAVTLNERFSQVLMDQLSRSRMRTIDPVLLQQRGLCSPPNVVLLVCDPSVVGMQPFRRRRSVWTRLGWQWRRRNPFRPRGFWSFMSKYRRRNMFTSFCRGRLGQRFILRTRNIQKLTAEQSLKQRGWATPSRRRNKGHVPTKKQLDAELDQYMSMSKRRLDSELDDYMGLSKRSLDAQLEEYMSMAGQTHWD